jgi:phosphopantothenoylcysteine decarboxylase/phosphopantothenate--cysteine ligase
MAKMANGLANDLATTCLLAADGDVLIAPTMNPVMWQAAPTQRNFEQLKKDGIYIVGPVEGDMACGEEGKGRMLEPARIICEIEKLVVRRKTDLNLSGYHVLVTAGPTHEPIDPVRYIANRSSGKQGYAIAVAARNMGARVTLISGPTRLSPPEGVSIVNVETAEQMRVAVQRALPANIAVCAAAVADWRIGGSAEQKIKKKGSKPLRLELVENPNILKELSKAGKKRPELVIGFAAETQDLVENARKKRRFKKCDWIVANDVAKGSGTFGGDKNKVFIVRSNEVDEWPQLDKQQVARRLMREVANVIKNGKQTTK